MYKVLLVDDEAKALEGLQILIPWKELGFEICGTCENGEEAIEAITSLSPDLVVTDIRMPAMSGLELIKYVRQTMGLRIPFMITSAYGEFEYAKSAMEYGVRYYILKPIMEEEVVEVIREIHGLLEKQSRYTNLREGFDKETMINILSKQIQGIGIEESLKKRCENSFERKAWHCILIEIGRKTLEEEADGVIECLEEYIDSLEEAYLISVEANRKCIIVGMDKETDLYKEMHSFAYGLYHSIVGAYNANISIFVSQKADSLLDIQEAYKTALEAMKFKDFAREPKVILYEEIKDKSISFEFAESQYVERVLEGIEGLDNKMIRQTLEAIQKEYYAKQISLEMIKMFVTNAMYRSINPIPNTDAEGKDTFSQYDINRLSQADLSMEEMMEILTKHCEKLIQYKMEIRENKAKGVLYDVELYIRKYFQESLKIKDIARHFYINPVYLGQIFAKRYGVSINEYLHKLRIEEAKRLLDETDMKLNEIAEKVGYTNYSKFIQKFEQYVKVKPSMYNTKK